MDMDAAIVEEYVMEPELGLSQYDEANKPL